MKREESLFGNIDWTLFIVFAVMVLIGIANVYSAAFNPKAPFLFDFSQKYGKQIMWVAFSTFLGLLVFLIDASIYRKFLFSFISYSAIYATS
jgi:rod shape determining protein RodA